MTCIGRAVALGALSVLVARSAPAQAKPTATIGGVVRDSSGRPIEAAEVWLVGPGRKVATGPDGSFRFADLKGPVRTWISARHIGHFPAQTAVAAESGTEMTVTIVLAAQPFELPELTVRAAEKAQRRRLIDFVWRAQAFGQFLTRDDIERSRVSQLGHLVIRYLPFKNPATMDEPGGWGDDIAFASEVFSSSRAFYPVWNPSAEDQAAFTMGLGYYPAVPWTTPWPGPNHRTRDCPPAVAVNGGPISAGEAVNDFKPDEVEALEIYRSGGGLPFEYSMGGRSACGLVVIWRKGAIPVEPAR